MSSGAPFLSPAGLASYLSGGRWIPAAHLRLLSSKLVDVAARRIKRLVVLMPPRHGKSNLVSEWFIVWYLTLFSEHRVILTSYEADFASSWGRKVRDHINEFAPLLGIAVRDDSSAKDRWDLVGTPGGMMTAGAGGAITGKGADLFVIDDPVKNNEQALSETFRKKQWDWMLSTALSRIEPNGVMVVIMTHWHQDDIGGRIIRGDLEHDGTVKLSRIELTDPQHALLTTRLWPSILGVGRSSFR